MSDDLRVQRFGATGGLLQISTPEGQKTQVVNAMKRRAQMGGGVSRMAMAPFNPFIQNLDIPQDYALRNVYKRHFFKTNPIVGNAIELHSEFALSDFHLEHEDEAIEEFLNDMLHEAGFLEMLLMASVEYWLIGELNWFSFFDSPDNPSCYTGFCLLDPNKLSIINTPFVQGHYKEEARLQISGTFETIVKNGPNNAETGMIYRHLPKDMVTYCLKKQPMPLSPLQYSRMKRNNYFSIRGESILERIFPLLLYKDKLRAAQIAIADRYVTPTEIFKVGETGEPADNAELEALREAIQATYFDYQKLIIWHHALQYECVGPQDKIPALWTELDNIDNEVCAGLLINKGLILGDASTFASDVVRYDILINRYMMYRQKIEGFIRNLLAPILKIHEIYVPESKVKSMTLRMQCGKGRPLAYPTIRWDKQTLRDENTKLELMTKLVEKRLIPESTLIRMLNIDPKTAAKKVDEEALANVERKANLLKQIKAKGIPMTAELAQILGMEEGSGEMPPGGGEMPTSIGGGGDEPMPVGGNLDETNELPNTVPGANEKGEAATAAVSGGMPGGPNPTMPMAISK